MKKYTNFQSEIYLSQDMHIKLQRTMEETYWDYAAPNFKHLRSPWRPAAQDITIMESMVRVWVERSSIEREISVLVLGVTPEIINMSWPDRTHIMAIDKSKGMIRAFWPGGIRNKRTVVHADWIDLAADSDRFHIAIGDGAFNTFTFPKEYHRYSEIISELLDPVGLFVIRVFTQENPKENPEDVVELVKSGRIAHYHEFTFRFLTACQSDVCRGLTHTTNIMEEKLAEFDVSLYDIYELTGHVPSNDHYIDPPPKLNSLKITYPTKDQFIESVSSHFNLVDIQNGNYTTGFRCPVFAFQPIS